MMTYQGGEDGLQDLRGSEEDSQAYPEVHQKTVEILAQTIAQMSDTIARLSAENAALVEALMEPTETHGTLDG